MELENAVMTMKTGRAPCPDGLTVEAVRVVCEVIPGEVLKMYNALLTRQEFLKNWKVAKVVLLPIQGRDTNLPASYRPICLINVCGKLFEGLLRSRLEAELKERHFISGNQHGFRKGKSTTSAIMALKAAVTSNRRKWCIMVTLAIENSFNMAS